MQLVWRNLKLDIHGLICKVVPKEFIGNWTGVLLMTVGVICGVKLCVVSCQIVSQIIVLL